MADQSVREAASSAAPPESLKVLSASQKEKALALLETAHALLLANHGQLSSLSARQAVDSTSFDFQFNALPGFDREYSGQCVGRFTEAQMYVRRALEELGVSSPSSQGGLRVIGRAETVFDGLFDLVALAADAKNLQQNRRFGEEVRAKYDAVRLSDPDLAQRTKPLAPLDLDTGEEGVGRLLDYVSPLVGSPRFWPKDKLFVFVGLPLLAMALIFGGVVYGLRAAPYADAMRTLQHDNRAVAALGEPIRAGWAGKASRDGKNAELELPVSGPRAGGTLRVKARETKRGWVFLDLRLALPDSEIDLRPSAQIPMPGPP